MGLKVLTVFGTRPEAIKMCPVVKCLEENADITSLVCVTSQHKEMLDQVLRIFHVVPDYDLDIMQQRQTISEITTKILEGLTPILKIEQPDIVLVQGDTTTCLASALAAFYRKIPVGHVEAGLRSYDRYSPFPEEINRRITSQIAEIHFAPTKENVCNLLQENIHDRLVITGNTVIDSFKYTVRPGYQFKNKFLSKLIRSGKRLIIVTVHRRESIGEPLKEICSAVKEIVRMHKDVEVICPVHLNPAVREIIYSILDQQERIYLVEPLDVEDMHNLMCKCDLVMTDSGGLQEEAPYFHVPVIVLRNETERQEAVKANTAVVAGVERKHIVDIANKILTNDITYRKMALAENPFGDGYASERIVMELLQWHARREGNKLNVEGGV
ncbi:MAG: UDP-N-acetylglucosamine 2-epimerase (non-hydrolyzing) [bacterium]|nr:UDP-N-acetylglucosamine 2-epimerase (non-hydrolyzing) [bacterium]